MRRRILIFAILAFMFTMLPLAGLAEPAPTPVKVRQLELGSPEMPAHEAPAAFDNASADASAGQRDDASAAGEQGMAGPVSGEQGQAEPPAVESDPVEAPIPFDMVGFTWAGRRGEDVSAQIRTSENGSDWSDWTTLDTEEDLPDPESPDARGQRPALGPAFTGPSNYLQVRWDGGPDRANPSVHVLDTKGRAASWGERLLSVLGGMLRGGAPRASASSGMPPIIMRPSWGADEGMRTCDPEYGLVKAGIVHHTVTPNGYGPGDSAGIIRGIMAFHIGGNGWCDIGYNFLVDAYGQIFEGRFGGVDKAVSGAHSYGSNYRTTGVSLIGTFTSASAPSAMRESLAQILDWKLDVHHVNPLWRSDIYRRGDDAQWINIANISGHRNAFPTSCPGDGVYNPLIASGALANDVYNRGGQKIFYGYPEPSELGWNGSGFGPANFAAWFKYSTTWTLNILNPLGQNVGSWSGSGDSMNISWLAQGPGGQPAMEGAYTYKLEVPGAFPTEGVLTLGGNHSFETYLLAYNPQTSPAEVTLTVTSNTGVVATPTITVPAQRRSTVNLTAVAPWREISTKVDSSIPVLAERSSYFNYKGSWDGGHAGFGTPAPGTEWFFGEGYTGAGFEEYLTLQNPNAAATTAMITYMFNPSGTQTQPVNLPANSRTTVNVNGAVGAGKEVAVKVTSGAPIVVERPQYFDYKGIRGGDNVMGAKSLASEWIFAEGYTGGSFDQWLTMANPGATAAQAQISFFGNSGPIKTINRTVAPGGRTTVHVNDEVGPGKEVSTRVTSTQPIVAERPVYFNYMADRPGGHVAMGATATQTRFDFAEGYTGTGFDEYITLLNPGGAPITVDALYAFASQPPLAKSYNVPAGTRVTIPVHDEVSRAGDVSVTLSSSQPFSAERPMYFVYKGSWRGGSVAQGGPSASTTWYFAEGYTG